MALFAVLAILAGIALLSCTVFVLTATEVGVAGRHQHSTKSFYHADGAVHHFKGKIELDLAAGSLKLTNANETVNYPPPTGSTFDPVTNFSRLADGRSYFFRAVGRENGAMTMIDVVFRRRSSIGLGCFANSLLDMKNSGGIYSYNSTITSTPTPATSTGEADSGSNEQVITHNNSTIDGNLILGRDTFGNPAAWANPGSGAIITGEAGVQVPRIDPDPLGAVGGMLAAQFIAVATSNRNASAVPAIPANRKISLGNKETMTLTAGDYYISDITLNNGATLIINPGSGQVAIYLTGSADFKNGSTLNISGSPDRFSLFSNANVTIDLYHGSAFKGLLYAPYADVEVKNSADFYGLVWADALDIKNTGDVYIDTSLMSRYPANKINLISWKEVRD